MAAKALLGNASTQMTKERRRKAITAFNRKVHPLAEEEEIFQEAAPLLLAQVLESKVKSHLESLKCLVASSQSDSEAGQGFRQGHSHYSPRGSGQHHQRGGNHQRRFPMYPKGKENFHFKKQNNGKNQ